MEKNVLKKGFWGKLKRKLGLTDEYKWKPHMQKFFDSPAGKECYRKIEEGDITVAKM